MLSHSHSTSGAMVFAAALPVAPIVGFKVTGMSIAVGLLATAGAALIPDADHPSALIARTWGDVSEGFCRWFHRICGGHREASHGLWFVPFTGLFTWVILAISTKLPPLPQYHYRHWHLGPRHALPVVLALLLYFLITLGLKALHLAHGLAHPIGFGMAVAGAATVPGLAHWLPYAVALGTLAHILGDSLTVSGCPLLYPRQHDFRVHAGSHVLIRRTGNFMETWFVSPVMTVATGGLLFLHFWH